MEQTIPPETFTYQIIGLAYQVHNALGYGYREKHYQRAFEQELKKTNLPYRKEAHLPLRYLGVPIGRYYADFVIDNCLVVEWKVAPCVCPSHIRQVLGYLRGTKINLGLLLVVTESGILVKRVIL